MRTLHLVYCFTNMVHLLRRTQLVKTDMNTIWDFFSSPENLSLITPPYLHFRITSETEGTGIYAGQIITYKVSPLLHIPLTWVTEITHVAYHQFFVDEQRHGPYKLWHHKHHFRQVDGGILMTDVVHYQLPMLFIGDLAHLLFVKRQLDNIFNYRQQKIETLFNQS